LFADPDPAFHSNADPDPASKNKMNPCGSGSAIWREHIKTTNGKYIDFRLLKFFGIISAYDRAEMAKYLSEFAKTKFKISKLQQCGSAAKKIHIKT
jgi:hypothetical protein